MLSAVLPRSIRFSIAKVDAALAHISEEAPAYNGSEPMPGVDAARARRAARSAGCTRSSPTSGSTTSLDQRPPRVRSLDIQRRCYRIGELVEHEFFAHRPLTAQEAMV